MGAKTKSMIVKIRVKVGQYNQYHIHNTLNLNISILKVNNMLLPITFTIQNVYLRRQVIMANDKSKIP